MTSEERQDKFQQWITYAVIIAIPVIVTISLFWLELGNRVDDVQKSRAELTYIGCLEQNESNLDAVKAVTALFDASVERGEQTRAEANTAVAATKQIINALSPRRDCSSLVERRFGFVPNVRDSNDV